MRSLSLPTKIYAKEEGGYFYLYLTPEEWKLAHQRAVLESDPSQPIKARFLEADINWRDAT